MSDYQARIHWRRGDAVFSDGRFSRRHLMHFDGGAVVPGSSSPHVVRVPFSEPANVDPEEAFVAALSSCHLLFFLNFAARQGFTIDAYRDEAEGIMEKNERGRLAMTTVTLRPRVVFSGSNVPSAEEIAALHHEAHESCYLANSVRTKIRIEAAG